MTPKSSVRVLDMEERVRSSRMVVSDWVLEASTWTMLGAAGNEASIFSCTYSTNTGSDYHFEDAGARCRGEIIHLYASLSTPDKKKKKKIWEEIAFIVEFLYLYHKTRSINVPCYYVYIISFSYSKENWNNPSNLPFIRSLTACISICLANCKSSGTNVLNILSCLSENHLFKHCIYHQPSSFLFKHNVWFINYYVGAVINN